MIKTTSKIKHSATMHTNRLNHPMFPAPTAVPDEKRNAHRAFKPKQWTNSTIVHVILLMRTTYQPMGTHDRNLRLQHRTLNHISHQAPERLSPGRSISSHLPSVRNNGVQCLDWKVTSWRDKRREVQGKEPMEFWRINYSISDTGWKLTLIYQE